MKRSILVLSAVLLLSCACCRLPEQGMDADNGPTQKQPAVSSTTDSAEPIKPTQTEQAPSAENPTDPLPSVTEPERPPELTEFVSVKAYVPNVRTELAYATEDNFTGTIIYDFSEAYLRYGTVRKLAQAAEELEKLGYGLVIWDAYRPVYAQQRLWDSCPDPAYVSKPGTGSQSHCRGIAVDVTLYDLSTGELLTMPSGFDEFSPLGDRDYGDCSEDARDNAILLENILCGYGFKPYSGEWWHFSDTDNYEIEYSFDPACIA